MGDIKRTEEWYEKINKQFEEDRKTHDFSNPEMDKGFVKMLNEKMGREENESVEEWYERLNKQFLEDSKTHDYRDPEMDKWFAEMLEKKMREDHKESAEEWYERINKQFEEDSKTQDFSDPEMDKWFADMLDKKVRKSRSGKIAKVASIVAGIVLVLSVVLNGFAQVAYGESLIDIIRNSIKEGKFTISAIATNDKSNEFDKYEEDTIRYDANSIEEIYRQIKQDIEINVNEWFYVKLIPEYFQQWTAKYNIDIQKLSINSQWGEQYIYIYQELNYDDMVSGTILESEIVASVFNENLQIDIDIIRQMDNVRNRGYYIEVFYNDKCMRIEGDLTLDEFEIIAKNLSLLKGN